MKIRNTFYNLENFPFSNYKIIQLSDLHLGCSQQTNLYAIIDQVLLHDPNLVVLTGDLIEGDVYLLKDALEVFKKLTEKVKTFFIFGNHDFQYNKPEDVISVLESVGIRILINESVWIGDEVAGFNLVGIADPIAVVHHYDVQYHPDIKASLSYVRTGFPTILLSHRSIQRYMEKKYRVNLMLSGHIHGGQIFPFGYLVLMLKEDSGEKLYLRTQKVDSRFVYISKGLGTTRLPFRFLVPPEINCITLNPL